MYANFSEDKDAERAGGGFVDQDQRTLEQSRNSDCQSVTHWWIRVRKCVKCSLKSSRKSLIHIL